MNPLLFERFEFKYFVPEDRIGDLRALIRPYVRLDDHADARPDRRYTIHNLYLDTPALEFYHAALRDADDRFKLRVRWYDSAPGQPLFFEVKRKVRQVVVKQRACVPREALASILDGSVFGLAEGQGRAHLARFTDLMLLHGAEPYLYGRYSREAYESIFGEYSRLSIDREMCFQPTHDWDLVEDDRAWTYLDCASSTQGIRRATLLELKFEKRYPAWMVDVVEALGLKRVGFSKYGAAVTDILGMGVTSLDCDREPIGLV